MCIRDRLLRLQPLKADSVPKIDQLKVECPCLIHRPLLLQSCQPFRVKRLGQEWSSLTDEINMRLVVLLPPLSLSRSVSLALSLPRLSLVLLPAYNYHSSRSSSGDCPKSSSRFKVIVLSWNTQAGRDRGPLRETIPGVTLSPPG